MDDLKERAWCEWWEEVENFGLRAERAETDLGRHAFAWCDAAFTAGYDAQAARIEALEAQLAAREAEIAAWLRSGAGITPGPDGLFSHEDACILEGLKDAADAIDARAYRSNPQ